MPAIRRRTDADLRRAGPPREKVLAAVVRLLERTLIRVGNAEYARDQQVIRLDDHARRARQDLRLEVRFIFRGKSGIDHELALDDRRLATIVKQCRDLPGQELFQYRDQDDRVIDVSSDDVNAYLKEMSGEDFTSKDFRTWARDCPGRGSAARRQMPTRRAPTRKHVVRVVEEVAKQLGNTKAVCRKCYIHPAVIDAYLDGAMGKSGGGGAPRARSGS